MKRRKIQTLYLILIWSTWGSVGPQALQGMTHSVHLIPHMKVNSWVFHSSWSFLRHFYTLIGGDMLNSVKRTQFERTNILYLSASLIREKKPCHGWRNYLTNYSRNLLWRGENFQTHEHHLRTPAERPDGSISWVKDIWNPCGVCKRAPMTLKLWETRFPGLMKVILNQLVAT